MKVDSAILAKERLLIGWTKEFLESATVLTVVSSAIAEDARRPAIDVPEWVWNAGRRLRKTLFAPPEKALRDNTPMNYRLGYAGGRDRWSIRDSVGRLSPQRVDPRHVEEWPASHSHSRCRVKCLPSREATEGSLHLRCAAAKAGARGGI